VIAFFAGYKLVLFFRQDGASLTIATFSLTIIVVTNLYRLVHMATDYYNFFGLFDGRLQVLLLTIDWPLSNLTLFLISLYWEELLNHSFGKSITFVKRYKNVFIGVFIGINALNILIIILITTSLNLVVLAITVLLNRSFFIFLPCASFIYSIINSYRINRIMNKSEIISAKKEIKKGRMNRTTFYILTANFCSLIFAIAQIFLVILGVSKIISYYLYFLALVGVMLSDFMITFAFSVNKPGKTGSSKSGGKVTGSSKVRGKFTVLD